MARQDLEACSEAEVRGSVTMGSKLIGQSGGKTPLPREVCHGTTVQAGLKIITEGFQPSEKGTTGSGVYGFAVPDLKRIDAETTDVVDDTNLRVRRAWERTVSGGYNGGCMIISKTRGILIKRQAQEAPIPAGATAFDNNDQYCSNSASLLPISVTFTMEGLVGALSHNLEENKYSEAYYKACVSVRRALETAAAVKDWGAQHS